ncbi:MAG: HEAT repeat domain-containing protein [Caldilineaceae bacterium]
MEVLFGALAEAILSILIQDVAERPLLSTLRGKLKGDSPEKLALQRALDTAFDTFSRKYPDLAHSFLDRFFLLENRQVAVELAKFLTPHKTPDKSILQQLWDAQFSNNPQVDLAEPFDFLLNVLEDQIKSQVSLQPFISGRALEQLHIIARRNEEQLNLQKEIRDLLAESQKHLDHAQSQSIAQGKDPFQKYLERSRSHVLHLLKGTIYNLEKPLLSMEVTDTPDAITIPFAFQSRRLLWSVPPTESKHKTPQNFDNFLDAFENHDQRVLLLGEPGGGKTTTLLTLALQKIDARLQDNTSLLPIYAEVWTWDGEAPLPQWLAQATNLNVEILEREILSGQVLLLLDGLDELHISNPLSGFGRAKSENSWTEETARNNGESTPHDYQAKFIASISNLSKTPVVVACRTTDYAEISHKTATKFTLDGAVTLQPLTDEQVAHYLKDQPALWQMLQTDDELRDILRTPLLLTVFSIAYSDLNQESIGLQELRNSPGELQDRIFEDYVKRRLDFEQARQDKPLPFSFQQIYEILGEAPFIEWGEVRNRYDLRSDFWLQRINNDESSSNPSVSDLFGSNDDKSNAIATHIFYKLLGQEADEFIALLINMQLMHHGTHESLDFSHILLRDHFAFRYIWPRLFDVDTGTRYRAAKVLGHIRDARALEQLVELLKDGDYRVRQRALQSLIAIGKPAVEPLLLLLTDKDDKACVAAIRGLGKIGDPRAIEPLMQIASGTIEERANQAGETLVVDFNYVGGIYRYLQSVDRRIRKSDKKGYEQQSAMWGLIHFEKSVVSPLIDALRNFHDSGSVLWIVKVVLIEKCKTEKQLAAKLLVNILVDTAEDTIFRMFAAEVLAEVPIVDPELIEVISTALGDPNSQIRLHAGYVLIKQGIMTAVEPFLVAFGGIETHSDEFVENSLEALKKMGSALVEPLIAAMYELAPHSAQEQFWVMSRTLLTEFGEQSASLLADMLMISERPSMPFAVALVALGMIKHREERTTAILIQVLVDQNEESSFRNAAAMALAQLGTLAIDATVDLFDSSDPDVRHYAAWILGQIKAKRTAKYLIKALDDDADSVQLQAVMSLGQIRSKRGIKPLTEALKHNSWNTRYHAVQALGEIGDTRTIENIAELLTPRIEDEETLCIAEVAGYWLVNWGDTRGIERTLLLLQKVEPDDEKEWIEAFAKNFSRIGEPALQPLSTGLLLLETDRGLLWSLVAKSFEQMGEPAIRFLLTQLQHEQVNVRFQASKLLHIIVLEWKKLKAQIDPVFEWEGLKLPLVSDIKIDESSLSESPVTRLKPLIIRALIDALEDNSQQIQDEAAQTLLNFGEAVADPFLSLLVNPTKQGRFAAAWILGELKIRAQCIPCSRQSMIVMQLYVYILFTHLGASQLSPSFVTIA